MGSVGNNAAIRESGTFTPVILPPKGIETIDPAIDLATLGYIAIESNTEFIIYFGTDSGTTYTWPANIPLGIHRTAGIKLQSSGNFLTY